MSRATQTLSAANSTSYTVGMGVVSPESKTAGS
jgi:hypothetical protein